MPPTINSREDLLALVGTPAYAEAIASLAGTLWRFEKDDVAGAWVAVEDDSTIGRFGLTRADFPNAAPPAPPEYIVSSPIVPDEISRRQFYQQLAIDEKITKQEAIAAAMSGTLPAAVQACVDALPEDQRFGALMALASGALKRTHPLVAAFGAMQDMTEADIDAFWIAAAALI